MQRKNGEEERKKLRDAERTRRIKFSRCLRVHERATIKKAARRGWWRGGRGRERGGEEREAFVQDGEKKKEQPER